MNETKEQKPDCATCLHREVCGKRQYWGDDKLAAFGCRHYLREEGTE